MAVITRCPLTRRQLDALRSIADGMTYKQIAARDGRSTSTVRTHVHNAVTHLGVPSALQAILACQRHGWLDLEPGTQITTDPLADLEFVFRELIQAVREHGVGGLTPTQRCYLAAFDDHLYARTPEAHDRTRERMNRALYRVMRDAGIERDRPMARRNLVELIAASVERAQAA